MDKQLLRDSKPTGLNGIINAPGDKLTVVNHQGKNTGFSVYGWLGGKKYVTGVDYKQNDLIVENGHIYIVKADFTATSMADDINAGYLAELTEGNQNMVKTYTTGVAYSKFDLIQDSGILYLAEADFTATNLQADITAGNIKQVGIESDPVKPYVAGYTYEVNDLIVLNGLLYQAQVEFTATTLNADITAKKIILNGTVQDMLLAGVSYVDALTRVGNLTQKMLVDLLGVTGFGDATHLLRDDAKYFGEIEIGSNLNGLTPSQIKGYGLTNGSFAILRYTSTRLTAIVSVDSTGSIMLTLFYFSGNDLKLIIKLGTTTWSKTSEIDLTLIALNNAAISKLNDTTVILQADPTKFIVVHVNDSTANTGFAVNDLVTAECTNPAWSIEFTVNEVDATGRPTNYSYDSSVIYDHDISNDTYIWETSGAGVTTGLTLETNYAPGSNSVEGSLEYTSEHDPLMQESFVLAQIGAATAGVVRSANKTVSQLQVEDSTVNQYETQVILLDTWITSTRLAEGDFIKGSDFDVEDANGNWSMLIHFIKDVPAGTAPVSGTDYVTLATV